MAVIAIFLAAFAIPVTFNSIMWVIGSGSLANVASFTPGAIGVTQATNALALKTCCDVPNNTAVAYSTAQQLVTSAWNVVVRVDPGRLGLRLDGREAARRRRVHRREGEGGRDEGRPEAQERREERARRQPVRKRIPPRPASSKRP